jgi:hypothetical protein
MMIPSLQPAKMTSQHSTSGEQSELPPKAASHPVSVEEVSAESNSPPSAGEPKEQGSPGGHLEPENEPDLESLWYTDSTADKEYFKLREADDSIEKVLKSPSVAGWPQVASYLAKKPYYASFSRFGELNVKSLLYYQTQLGRLQKELHLLEHDDLHGYGYGDSSEEQIDKEVAMQFASRSDFLMCGKDSKQRKLILEIRLLLKEYSELSKVHCFGGPL